MKEKAYPYLIMALSTFLIIALELLVLFIGSLFYGTMDFTKITELKGVSASLIHWGITCVVWGAGAWFLYVVAKKRGFFILENKSKAPYLNWIIVFALLGLSIFSQYLSLDMRFKALVEFQYMQRTFENQAVIAFIAQYIYYLVESVLILALVVFGQKFGEVAFNKNNVPWGGILCGLTWGLGHILSQDFVTGIFAASISFAYGIVYLLLKKNVRYAYPIIALMFML